LKKSSGDYRVDSLPGAAVHVKDCACARSLTNHPDSKARQGPAKVRT
jgi:hypothetical protein